MSYESNNVAKNEIEVLDDLLVGINKRCLNNVDKNKIDGLEDLLIGIDERYLNSHIYTNPYAHVEVEPNYELELKYNFNNSVNNHFFSTLGKSDRLKTYEKLCSYYDKLKVNLNKEMSNIYNLPDEIIDLLHDDKISIDTVAELVSHPYGYGIQSIPYPYVFDNSTKKNIEIPEDMFDEIVKLIKNKK